MRRRGWHIKEEEFLIKHYADLTIKEIKKELENLSGRKRTADSINAKIKRLKFEKRIEGHKDEGTVNRALIQRRKELG
ncbi:hypothetical protein LCGC14_1093160 [marine sediment metagenome]|uniref:Clr5 domain-containing protein n=1 Tax=marine sediment metagenome TaxID=412755 RepID=A0A0F9PUX1_9ZZZZ